MRILLRRTIVGARLPSSMAATREVAALAIVIPALVMILEGAVADWHDLGYGLLMFAAPTIAVAVMATRAAEGRGSALLLAMGVGFGAQLALALGTCAFIGAGGAEIIIIALVAAVVTCCIIGMCALPVLIAAGAVGQRRDLEAGDTLLGISGVCLAAFQILKMLVSAEMALFVPGLALGGLAFAIYTYRAIARRRWCAQASRGELAGWRVRQRTSEAELALLPPVFGSPATVSAIIEKVEMGGMLYRSGLVGQPVAAIRVAPGLEATP